MIGIILAGGGATRMGGGDKGLLHVGEVPILSRIIVALRPQCDALVLNANGDPTRFAGFGLPIVADGTPEPAGPLGGILAGLDWIAVRHPAATHAITVPTDTPFLPPDLAARLGGFDTIACARSNGRLHPTVACWPIALRDDLRAALGTDGIRKVGLFLERHGAVAVDWSCDPHDPFLNGNTPADIEAADAIAACGAPPPSV